MSSDGSYELVIYRKGSAANITCIDDNNSLVINGSWKYDHAENEVSTLAFQLSNGSIDASVNLLSPSCTRWSDGRAGAVEMGCHVRYSLFPTKGNNKTQVFYGLITDMPSQSKDGKLSIKCRDYLQTLNKEYLRIVYAGYRDSLGKSVSAWSDGVVQINGVSEMDGIVLPFADVAMALGDTGTLMGHDSSSNGGTFISGGAAVRQGFFATQDGFIGARALAYNGSIADTTITCKLYQDDGSGYGLGQLLGTATTAIASGDSGWKDFDMTGGTGIPLRLNIDTKYWLHFSSAYGVANSVSMNYYTPTGVVTSFDHYSGGAWTRTDGQNVCCYVDTVSFQHYDGKKYVYDPNGGWLYIQVGSAPPTPSQSYVYPVRGLLSYYYGKVTNRGIADALAKLNTGLVSQTSPDQNALSGTFSTSGKKLLDSFKELAGQFMPSGEWAGRQLTFGHYQNGGYQYVKWGMRLTSDDLPYVTFSYGGDTSNDDERRIIDYSGLAMRTDLRPPRVVVIGKDANGAPLCYTVTDRALADSFEKRMEGFANSQKIVDDNLVLLSDVQARGDGTIAMYQYNVWEGQITVSGVYPELIDLDYTSGTFGSGKVITLNISELGIFGQRFKVLAVSVEANQTTITVSNIDLSLNNAQRYYNAKSNKTEAFFAPVGLADNVYLAVFDDYAINQEPSWMELCDIGNNPIPGMNRVRCTRRQVPELNLNVHHAEFEQSNGHSVTPYGVGYIDLCSAASGGIRYGYALLDSIEPVRDERVDKLKTMRLIVDFMTRIV